MNDKEEIMRYLIDNIPLVLDMKNLELKHDNRNIHYKIYKYIKELQEEIRKLKIGRGE